jgi:LPXTG-motif cell wall-anchored protein
LSRGGDHEGAALRYARITAVAATATATALLMVPSVYAAPGQPSVPDAVTIIRVAPGAGSGEVELIWEAAPNATGYRVLRSATAGGSSETAAEIDITTGTATAAPDVVNVFSDSHSYVPPGGSFVGPDQSSQFNYVDVGPRQRCFAVIAFNPAGDGPASPVACGAPPGAAPAPTVTVTQFDCASVTVTGSGWEQTEATVEVGVPPSEGGESPEDLVAGPVQVFPDAQGNIAPTVLPFNRTPPDGDYVAVVLVDSLVREQSAGFALTGCGAVTAPSPPTTSAAGRSLPATGSSTMSLLAIGLVLVTLGFTLAWRTRTN